MPRKKKEEDTVVKVIGTPTMMLLPARNYKFEVDQEEHTIVLPRRGKYVDLDNELFTDGDGEFDFFGDMFGDPEGETANIFYLPSLSKVLFAVSKYPDLQDHQAFTPIAIIVKEKEINVVGNIINMLKKEE